MLTLTSPGARDGASEVKTAERFNCFAAITPIEQNRKRAGDGTHCTRFAGTRTKTNERYSSRHTTPVRNVVASAVLIDVNKLKLNPSFEKGYTLH